MCYEAIETGGTATVVLNAANEIAVDAFLAGDIGFTDIPRLIEMTLQKADILDDVGSLERILQADTIARTITRECLQDM